jgi:dipeptidyl aminopeptidase/acylaminoacyl peptidase
VTGLLRVLDLETGKIVQTVERAMLGTCWTAHGELLVPRSRADRAKPFVAGDGEITQISFNGDETTLFRGTLPGVTILSPAGKDRVLCLMHLEGEKGPIGLAQLTTGKRGAKRGETGVFDFWPSVSADGKRVLFTRSSPENPQVVAELRLADLANPAQSTAVPTDGPVGAPRWIGADRVAYVTKQNHLVLEDLDGSNRIDVTPALRAAFSPEESK